MLGNYRVAAQLVTSRVVLNSTELVTTLVKHSMLGLTYLMSNILDALD
jgi:hypothetical protein